MYLYRQSDHEVLQRAKGKSSRNAMIEGKTLEAERQNKRKLLRG